jgi:hypothetical protein
MPGRRPVSRTFRSITIERRRTDPDDLRAITRLTGAGHQPRKIGNLISP